MRVVASSRRRRRASVDRSIGRSVERVFERIFSRVFSSRLVALPRARRHHPRHHHHHHPPARRLASHLSRLSRRAHREHESPIRHRSPKMRRFRSRRSVDEGANRHGRSVGRSVDRSSRSADVRRRTFSSIFRPPSSRTARMETRGTGRASNGREITRWSARGDVAIGASRGCVVVEVRNATRRMTCMHVSSRMTCDE